MVGHRGRGRRVALLGLLALAGLTGCVQRRYTIRTDPPGALAIVNGQEIGLTPVSAQFTYYGDREVVLIKDGFQTERKIQPVGAPWWDNYLTEVVTENIIPINFRDERDFTYRLTPTMIPATNDLLQRAEAMRAQGQGPPPPRPSGIFSYFNF